MITRRATDKDLPVIIELYRFLQADDPVLNPQDESVREKWAEILRDTRLRYFVVEAENKTVVSCCALTIIPNLTRGMRSYGVIENVVTNPVFRKRGFATSVLRAALSDAWAEGCYKVMLLTGRKSEETLQFYERVGFLRGIKTGFVAYPEPEVD